VLLVCLFQFSLDLSWPVLIFSDFSASSRVVGLRFVFHRQEWRPCAPSRSRAQFLFWHRFWVYSRTGVRYSICARRPRPGFISSSFHTRPQIRFLLPKDFAFPYLVRVNQQWAFSSYWFLSQWVWVPCKHSGFRIGLACSHPGLGLVFFNRTTGGIFSSFAGRDRLSRRSNFSRYQVARVLARCSPAALGICFSSCSACFAFEFLSTGEIGIALESSD
jgi:hypothetical protein